MEDQDPLESVLRSVFRLCPRDALDVGCGCGRTTARLARYCSEVTAVDNSPSLISRCRKESRSPKINFLCADGTNLPFPDRFFNLVIEIDTLHHSRDWPRIILEMVRVSSCHVVISEPVDDLRTPAKQAAARLQDLVLELQHEVGYEHYLHLEPPAILDYLDRTVLDVRPVTLKDNRPDSYDEYWQVIQSFAARSDRPKYWEFRAMKLFRQLREKPLGRPDRLLIMAKRHVH